MFDKKKTKNTIHFQAYMKRTLNENFEPFWQLLSKKRKYMKKNLKTVKKNTFMDKKISKIIMYKAKTMQ